MTKTLRVGMIGYGFMGKAHSNAWRQVSHFFPLEARPEMHTICGRDRARVEAARGQLGWQHAATDWREVVDRSLTSGHLHVQRPTRKSRLPRKSGQHIICENRCAGRRQRRAHGDGRARPT
jgi:hypothetical protein